jgi:hypothetical protein
VTAHLSLVLEADLADFHRPVLFEIGPGRVDDGDVILLVAYAGAGYHVSERYPLHENIAPARQASISQMKHARRAGEHDYLQSSWPW